MLRCSGMSTLQRMGWGAAALVASSFVWACSMATSADSAFGGRNDGTANPAPGEGSSGNIGAGSDAAPSDLVPTDNAVIVVHAAKALAFRLCFENELSRKPLPDSELMPQANVVGVEVGTAVRLPPLAGRPGKVFLFEESAIRGQYFGAVGPRCENLLGGSSSSLRIEVGTIDVDLSSGVHLLVLKGCTGNTALRTYSKAECGSDWDETKGNLRVVEATLKGARRSGATLPVQVVNLSQPLEGARAGRDVAVTYGDLTAATSTHQSIVNAPAPFTAAQPTEPTALNFSPPAAADYAKLGFRVSLNTKPATGPDAGAAASETVLDQSLADTQRLSSPRDLPDSYFAAASNYVLLLLGDPNPTLPDGGPDTNELRGLHILGVPVIDPKGETTDAGTDAP